MEIEQYSLEGKLISTFSSQGEASRKTGVLQQNISSCIRHRLNNTGGYIWKHK